MIADGNLIVLLRLLLSFQWRYFHDVCVSSRLHPAEGVADVAFERAQISPQGRHVEQEEANEEADGEHDGDDSDTDG